MHTANVATAKNELSRLLRRVKRGESVIITERKHPIARLQPYHPAASDSLSGAPAPSLAPLYEAGVLIPPARPNFDVAAFLGSLPQTPPLSPEKSLTTAVLADREESP